MTSLPASNVAPHSCSSVLPSFPLSARYCLLTEPEDWLMGNVAVILYSISENLMLDQSDVSCSMSND